MKDQDKVKEQLINELVELRQRVAELETAETERKPVEEVLQESEQRYRMLVGTMNDGLAVMDKNMLLTFANDKFCQMLGYTRHELIGRPGTDLHDEANQRILEEQMARRRQG